MRKFSKDHEWVELVGEIATVGITNHAQHALGDVVYAETPAIGRAVKQGEAIAVVESVKAASDVYAPISGEVVEVNTALATDPARINRAPEGEGWFFKLRPTNSIELDTLMDEEAYKAYLKQ